MKWKVTGTYRVMMKEDFMGRRGRWEQFEKKTFSIMASRFSEIFDMRGYSMEANKSGVGTDTVVYRLTKQGNGVAMVHTHLHSTKPLYMYQKKLLYKIEINGEPATKEMLEKAVKFLERKYR